MTDWLSLLFLTFLEARQHGVGFYSFSKDEEERAKQMAELDRLRRQTENSRSAAAQSAEAKKAALDARLKKVRERKRQKLGLPPLSEFFFFLDSIYIFHDDLLFLLV